MSLDPVYFGKVPARGDFVRHNAGRPSVRALDDWIQRGLRTAKMNRGFERTFDGAPARCFFFNPRDATGALVGVMRPSRDRSGRRYPFLIALDLSSEAGGTALSPRRVARVPVHFRSFFAQALALTRRATGDRPDLEHLLDDLDSVASPERAGASALRGYKRYLRQTQLGDFWEQLWNGRADERRERLVGNLIEVLRPLHDGVPARFSLGMQFPLPPGDGSTAAFAAGFWWETCLRLLGFPDAAPSCFWTAVGADEPPAADRSALLFLRPPYARTFAQLFPADEESDHVYVLDRHGAARAMKSARDAPPRYARLLDGRQDTLWEFLQQLEPG